MCRVFSLPAAGELFAPMSINFYLQMKKVLLGYGQGLACTTGVSSEATAALEMQSVSGNLEAEKA